MVKMMTEVVRIQEASLPVRRSRSSRLMLCDPLVAGRQEILCRMVEVDDRAVIRAGDTCSQHENIAIGVMTSQSQHVCPSCLSQIHTGGGTGR